MFKFATINEIRQQNASAVEVQIELLPKPQGAREAGLDDLQIQSGKELTDLTQRTRLYGTPHAQQCIKLLRSMGIPCIVTTGAIAGEALASSLVVNGHANYVASHDAL